jgi:hypothetical protein
MVKKMPKALKVQPEIDPTETAPIILALEDFRKVGEVLNGTHWQSDVSRALGISKSQVTRYLDSSGNPGTSRPLTPLIAAQLQFVITERIRDLAALFQLAGMPHAGDAQAEAAIDMIQQALDLVPGKRPPRRLAAV